MSEEQDLVEAVSSWLNYKELTGMKGLLRESSMTIPIAEYLSTKHGREIKREVAHPSFPAKKGRPNQIDFVRKSKNDKNWVSVYEVKFNTGNQKLIVADICRLLCLSYKKRVIGTPHRYFIYAGIMNKNGRLLEKKAHTGEGTSQPFFEPLLSENEGESEKGVYIRKLEPFRKKMFNWFAKEHGNIPESFKTELKGFASGAIYGCALWRITPRQNFSEFTAESTD